MKRIALFISSLSKGGSERVMVNLAEYFKQKGYEVVLVTQYKRENEYDISPDIPRVYSEPPEEELGKSRIKNFITRCKTLRNIWKSYKPDIVLAFLGKNNLMAILTTALLPTRVVVSVRGEPTMEYPDANLRTLARFLFRFADGVVLQTSRVLDFFPKSVQRKAAILPNPINAAFINTPVKTDKDNVIVTAGRLDDNKNQQLLIHAFAKIANEFPATNAIIYGDGENRENLENLIREKDMESRIFMPGNVSDIADRVSKARAFVLTSNTEGLPNTVMEAMSVGTPVIATDCPSGGVATLIQDGVNGLLIPVSDAYALSDAMRKILTDDEFAGKLATEALKIRETLAPDIVNKRWEQYLIKCCHTK